jgi:cysteine desulfurase/selenocysteine lyase
VFCRGATEGLNLVSRFIQHDGLGGQEVMLTEAEHHSNIVPWLIATREVGASIRVVPITPEGDLDLAKLERMLSDRVRIVAVSHVSNVTGAVFPVERVTELAHAHGSLVLVDGAQAVPHLPVDVQRIGCDFYVGSGHKMGGPSSVGFLWGKAEVLERMPVADGGSTMAETVTFESFTAKPIPSKYEAGEPPFGEVEAWGPAIDYWTELGMERIAAYEEELTAYAVALLRGIDRVRVLGSPARRISVVSFVVDGMSASDVARQLDEQGIATRAGTLAAQPHLRALGVEEAVRASFAFYNTHEEAVVLAGALRRIVGGR